MGKKQFRKNVYIRLFWSFFKAGLFTIGGGLAMLPLIQKFVVEDEKWLTEKEMLDGIAISQSLPGVVAINIATYTGKKKAGTKGAIMATLGTIMPSFVIIILVALFLGATGENKYVEGALIGIKAAACGLILWAGVKLGKNILKNVFSWIIALAALFAVAVFNVNVVFVIIGAAVIGVIYNLIKTSKEVQ